MTSKINNSKIVEIAKEAGKIIMEIYSSDDFEVKNKTDATPITKADIAANNYICKKLNELYPDIPILSEENKEIPYDIRKSWKSCFIVDPIDGTKEFIKKNGEFTVNIAFAVDGVIKEGVIFAPALDLLYFTENETAYLETNGTKSKLPLKLAKRAYIMLASRSSLDQATQDFIDEKKLISPDLIVQRMGSSLKFCKIAEGNADCYARLKSINEWDTAAAQIILECSGAKLVSLDTQKPLRYNKKSLLTGEFIAYR